MTAGEIIPAHNPDVSTALDMTDATLSFRPERPLGTRSGEIWLDTLFKETWEHTAGAVFVVAVVVAELIEHELLLFRHAV